jgi:hypothetical protein
MLCVRRRSSRLEAGGGWRCCLRTAAESEVGDDSFSDWAVEAQTITVGLGRLFGVFRCNVFKFQVDYEIPIKKTSSK